MKIGDVFLSLKERQAAAGPHDWPGDFSHENGNYENTCHRCGENFFGHKRRVTCLVCSRLPVKEKL